MFKQWQGLGGGENKLWFTTRWRRVVPSNSSERHVEEILDIAEIKVLKRNWTPEDGRSRMIKLKGIAMDSKRNFFYSSGEKFFKNRVCGVYQRTYDGKRHYIRE